MTLKAVLIGAGGFGREALDIVEAHNAVQGNAGTRRIEILGVADDSPSETNLVRLKQANYEYLGVIDQVIHQIPSANYILGVGSPTVRKTLVDKLEIQNWHPLTIIHPSAVIGRINSIGPGSVICGGVQISTNTVLGRHVHVNPNATIGHDAVVDDFVSINPGAIISGEVVVGNCCLIGAGAVILQQLSIGNASVVGAGACVTKSVSNRSTVVGVPARPISTHIVID